MDIYRWVKNQWDRAAAIVMVACGVLALVLGWIGVSGSTLATQQIPYLASGGLFGLFALGIGATLWLSADLRDEWRVLNEIRDELHRGSSETSDGDALRGNGNGDAHRIEFGSAVSGLSAPSGDRS